MKNKKKSNNSSASGIYLKLRNDDALLRLKRLKANTFHSMVTDPPCGLGLDFKSSTRWDSNKGGKEHWISWLSEIMCEAHRVLKPGAYILCWTLPKQQHWSMSALEDAGFEIVDVVVNIFSRALIKGQDASSALDKKLGLERRVVGKNKNFRKANTHGRNFIYKANTHDTESQDPRSQAWEGYRTGLKPGQESWILARKKHEGTVADNILKHGCGAIFVGKKNKDRIQSNAVLTHHYDCDAYSCVPGCIVRALRKQNNKAPGYFKSFYYADKIGGKERGALKHPTIKPLDLMRFLVHMVTPKGGKVLDPFMGSGSTGDAALSLGCGFYGIDSNKEHYTEACGRLYGKYT